MTRKEQQALKKLRQVFKTSGFQNGDLVVTAEIHRVVDKDWGRKNHAHGMKVEGVFGGSGTRIMDTGRGGQQAIMGLR